MSESFSEIVEHFVSTVTNLGDYSLKYLSRLEKNATRLILGVRDRDKLGIFCVRDGNRALKLIVIAGDKIITGKRIKLYGDEAINEIVSTYLGTLRARGRRAQVRHNTLFGHEEVSVPELLYYGVVHEVDPLAGNIAGVIGWKYSKGEG